MYVICYGDSNTYGFDPCCYLGGRYEASFRWTEILAKKTGWEIRNEGTNGREIPRTETRFSHDIDLLIIMLGTNDLLQGADPATVTHRMEYFLNGLPFENDKVLLIAPPHMKFCEWVTEQSLINASIQLPKHYRTLAEKIGIRFIDAGEWSVPIAFDGVHFTESGHIAFAEALLKQTPFCYESLQET